MIARAWDALAGMLGGKVATLAWVATAAALAWGGLQAFKLANERAAHQVEIAAHQATIAGHARELATRAEVARLASEAERETERLRRQARDRGIDETNEQLARTQRAADDLRGYSSRLRDQVDVLAAGAAGGGALGRDPAAGADLAPGAAAGLVLAELYRGTQAEADDLARAFDDARARGLGCERDYDALRQTAGQAAAALMGAPAP
jgi:hypothetical protein